MTWNLGSVAATVLDLVPDVPTAISGTRLLEIADRQREFVQNWTGVSIGSNAIGIDHQNPILNLTIAETTRAMSLVGGDASTVKLGEFSISKGSDSNLLTTSKKAKEMAMEDLRALGRAINYNKANG